jgi:outer membrane protein, heavy metal efflux system
MNQKHTRALLGLLATTTLCSTFVPSAVAADTGSMTESQYVDQVVRAGLTARIADMEASVARADAVGVGAWGNPSVNWQRESVGAQEGPGATQDIFALSVPIVLSGRLGLEREAALAGAEAAAFRRSRAIAELRYQALNRFYDVVAASQRREVLVASLKAVRQLADSIATREKAGDASGYDRLRIALEAATVNDALNEAKAREETAKTSALSLLPAGHEFLPDFTGDLSRAPPVVNSPLLLSESRERRGDLRALRLEAAAAEQARQAAARSWIPDPSISGGVQLLDAGKTSARAGYVVGVELPFPLFQRRQGEQARATSRRDLAQARLAHLEREIDVQVVATQEQSYALRMRLETFRKDVLARALELRRIATAAYRGGASDLLVLVDAERGAREAQLGAVDLARAVIRVDSDLLLMTGVHDGPQAGRSK